MASARAMALVLLAIACVHMTLAQAPAQQLIQKRSMHLCGGQLVDALTMVCQWNARKRSATATLPEDQSAGEVYEDRWLSLPTSDVTPSPDVTSLRQRVLQTLFTPHSQERRLYASGLRTKRSIVDECCSSPCDLDTLRLYC